VVCYVKQFHDVVLIGLKLQNQREIHAKVIKAFVLSFSVDFVYNYVYHSVKHYNLRKYQWK